MFEADYKVDLFSLLENLVHRMALTVKTLNIGTPRPATVVVLNIKQFNFTMMKCLRKM